MTIAQRYQRLRAEVPPHVTIVAVSKLQPQAALREAVEAGVTDCGENYVREAAQKLAGLRVKKHFIGRVQTNKAKLIAATFDLVQSVDRIEAGTALSKAAAALDKTLPVLLQINISPAERSGCPPDAALDLAAQLRGLSGLRLDGLMAIGPITRDPGELARAFELAARTWRKVGGPVLSIGMSGDWRAAVEAGSTMIRIGAAIFGPRPGPPASKSTSISS